MGDCLRVLHAADLALHEPLGSVGVLPAHLREIANQARERVALRVFNAARSTPADLLLLTGRLADFSESPRLSCFLGNCFRQLKSDGVSVAWLPDRLTELSGAAHSLQDLVELPRQGRIFCELPHKKARILIADSPGVPISSDDGPIDLVVRRVANSIGIELQHIVPGVDGKTQHPIVAVQPDGPFQDQQAGMWMTDAAPGQIPVTRRLPSAAVGWTTETIEIRPASTGTSLVDEMLARCHALEQVRDVELLLVHWQLTGTGPLWDDLIGTVFPEELLQHLRPAQPLQSAIWTRRIELLPSDEQLMQWAEQPAIAQAFQELDLLTPGDLSAAQFTIGPAMPHFGSMMNRIDLGTLKLRVVRELRQSPPASRSQSDGTRE